MRLHSGVRGRGGTGVRDYSGGGGSALRVISSPPEFLRPFGSKRAKLERGGEPGRAGWSERGHRPPRDSP